ncbi:hypothetical protein MCY_00628 [Bartonella rattimassiliensis 15908]|uniref:Uncharacterized protein n=1 Tax=Bartonella rattimassiliensis 15908 TaxID=1094556 RepID=J0QM74_9HYPH|nr:hypothetical protein MCY_00628 [Bartonella rattimassiliensis 15908]
MGIIIKISLKFITLIIFFSLNLRALNVDNVFTLNFFYCETGSVTLHKRLTYYEKGMFEDISEQVGATIIFPSSNVMIAFGFETLRYSAVLDNQYNDRHLYLSSTV